MMMSRMVVVPMKRKMLLRMSEVKVQDGVDAYFFRIANSDCNGYIQDQIDKENLFVYNCIGL